MPVPADQRAAQLLGAGRWRDDSYYTASALGALNYVEPFTFFGLLVCTRVFDASLYSFWRANQASTTAGWHQYYQAGNFFSRVSNATTDSALAIAVVPDVGQVLVLATSYDGATHRMRLSEIASTSAAFADGMDPGTDPFRIGARAGTPLYSAAPFAIFAGLGTGSAALSDADMLTTIRELVRNAEQGRSLDEDLSVFAPEDYVDLADAWQGPGAPLKASFAARLGGSTFVKTGEPEPYGTPARF